MPHTFSVRTGRHFERLARSLRKGHPDFDEHFAEAINILRTDPYNRGGKHATKKLHAVPAGEGQYRLRLGRWRFRYDIHGQDVIFTYCGLRREDTYRI